MLGIGILALFVGYQNLVYGWDQLNHGNAGYFQILWPGSAKNIAPDDSGGAATTNTTSNAGGLTGPAGVAATAAGQPNGTGVGGSGVFGKGSLYGDTLGKIFPIG